MNINILNVESGLTVDTETIDFEQLSIILNGLPGVQVGHTFIFIDYGNGAQAVILKEPETPGP